MNNLYVPFNINHIMNEKQNNIFVKILIRTLKENFKGNYKKCLNLYNLNKIEINTLHTIMFTLTSLCINNKAKMKKEKYNNTIILYNNIIKQYIKNDVTKIVNYTIKKYHSLLNKNIINYSFKKEYKIKTTIISTLLNNNHTLIDKSNLSYILLKCINDYNTRNIIITSIYQQLTTKKINI